MYPVAREWTASEVCLVEEHGEFRWDCFNGTLGS